MMSLRISALSIYIQQLKEKFYSTNVVVSSEQASQIEESTRTQSETLMWREERRKCITASKAGGIAKMRKSTKRPKKVEELLYFNFTGSSATRYRVMMEDAEGIYIFLDRCTALVLIPRENPVYPLFLRRTASNWSVVVRL